MWKTLLAGTAALAIAGPTLVYAQQRAQGATRWQPSQEDRAAFTDARIAALKAGLKLTPDQEKNWPAFETALRDIAKMHVENRAAMQQNEARSDDDPAVRLRRHAEMMTNVGANLTRLADAEEPLYQSLDDSQKNRFRLLSRILTSDRQHFAQTQGRMQGGRGMTRGDRPRDGGRRPGPRGMSDGDRGDHGMQREDPTGTGERL
jgi:hypothetical protein